jgi:DNA polymerase
MPQADIFDEIIMMLEMKRQSGGRRVCLDATTLRDFFGNREAGHPTVRQVAAARPATTVFEESTGQASDDCSPPAGPSPAVSAATEPESSAVLSDDWSALKERAHQCQACELWRGRTTVVFGEGNTDADLMFIGEGPGYHEDQSGRPFVGPAGQLLTRMIKAMQFDRKSVYIANIVKCRPPSNRNPVPAETAACLPFLNRQIELVGPKVLVLLGAVPAHVLLGAPAISAVRGKWQEYQGIAVMPTYHPSYLLRSPKRKKLVWEDLQLVMRRLGKDPEETLQQMKQGEGS